MVVQGDGHGQGAVSPGTSFLEVTSLTYLVFWQILLNSSLGSLLCPFFSQVFDATNTTRERRHMILHFAKENDFKVSQTSCLALGCS